MKRTDDEIAAGYIALQHAPTQERDHLFWAFEEMCAVVAREPDRAFQLVLMILRRDDTPPVVQILSAGPLEDLLNAHGEKMIGKIEEEARRNPKFAFLLGGVWPGSIPKEVWRKVEGLRDRRGWDGIPK